MADGRAPFVASFDRAGSLAVLGLAVLVLAPLAWPETFARSPEIPSVLGARGAVAAVGIGGLLCGLASWCLLPRGSRERWGTLLLTVMCVDYHYSFVDLGDYFGERYIDNVDWQRHLQFSILRLETEWIPHCYRFLPNCVVAWLEWLTGNYLAAALLYRLTTQYVLFLAIYRLGRRWFDHPTALVALLLYALIYPASIRYYAGQLTDPLSHLSFVLAAFFLATNRVWPFFATIVLGGLAKESVLVMPLFAAAWHGRSPREAARWLAAFPISLASLVGIRMLVAGGPAYEKISGVAPAHMLSNFGDVWHWGRQLWETVGILWVVAALRWGRQPLLLRRLALFLFPCLWGSSLVFSFLKEARNYVPLSIVLAIMASATMMEYLRAGASQERDESRAPDALAATPSARHAERGSVLFVEE